MLATKTGLIGIRHLRDQVKPAQILDDAPDPVLRSIRVGEKSPCKTFVECSEAFGYVATPLGRFPQFLTAALGLDQPLRSSVSTDLA